MSRGVGGAARCCAYSLVDIIWYRSHLGGRTPLGTHHWDLLGGDRDTVGPQANVVVYRMYHLLVSAPRGRARRALESTSAVLLFQKDDFVSSRPIGKRRPLPVAGRRAGEGFPLVRSVVGC